MVNQRFSLKGWDFKTWLAGNKDSLKILIAGAVGVATYFSLRLNPSLSASVGLLIAAISKMLLDTIDYYQSE